MLPVPPPLSHLVKGVPIPDAKSPGELLKPADTYRAGRGTFVRDGSIFASVVGLERVSPAEPSDLDQRPVVTVAKAHGHTVLVPEVGSVVTARVTKVTPRGAHCELQTCSDKLLTEKFSGLVRQQDVRLTEVDKVDLYKCFRPSDIVRAVVISLGDPRSYFLSTAGNVLGVIHGTSNSGFPLVPVDWETMKCTQTGNLEPRKVARL